MEQMAGKQSIQFARAPHILSGASMVGKKEGEGPLAVSYTHLTLPTKA